jgi:hypothetical protein
MTFVRRDHQPASSWRVLVRDRRREPGQSSGLDFRAMSARNLDRPTLRCRKSRSVQRLQLHGSARCEAGGRCRKSVPCSQPGQRAVGADSPAEDAPGIRVEYVQEAAVLAQILVA